MDKLTYAQLRAMAVSPSEPGAYSNSPLGADTGVHIHAGDLDVDIVHNGYKIAEVFPDRTMVRATSELISRLPEPHVRY